MTDSSSASHSFERIINKKKRFNFKFGIKRVSYKRFRLFYKSFVISIDVTSADLHISVNRKVSRKQKHIKI